MTVHASADYCLDVHKPAPPDYPSHTVSDIYARRPFAQAFETRRQALLAHIRRNPAPPNLKAPYYELARLAAGGAPHLGILDAALTFIQQRKDCSDFVLHSILRLLYQFRDHPLLDGALLERARQILLDFKYWPDEPGIDSLCTWTENHQILFASGAYLAGQLFPEEVFSNSGHTGREKMAIHRPRILRWLDLRFQTGFSEWLSHVYYDEDLTALVDLVDFCPEGDEIRPRAEMVIDLLLYDMALNSIQGVFGSSHGRSYANTKRWAAEEGTTDTQKLLFGMGIFSAFDNMSAIALALSPRYHMPAVINQVANHLHRQEMKNRQRMGIRLQEAGRWGIGFQDFEDGMALLSLEAYTHPRIVNLVMRMFDAYNWWENGFFSMFKRRRGLVGALRRLGLLPLVMRLFEKDVTRNTREEVYLYSYRTPDALLSSAQDYRKGYGGDQQHIWQASLGPDAVCFTTHPAKHDGPSPDYWTGSGSLPRVAQVGSVVIAVYNISTRPGLYLTNRLLFTHAWLPRKQFDQVVEREGWFFARCGEGYLALRSQRPACWQTEPGEDQDSEIIAPGKQNIWICEVGRQTVDGEFQVFIDRICRARLSFHGMHIVYHSPSQGCLEFGWRGPLRQNGHEVALHCPLRYDNPYSRAEFPMQVLTIRQGEHWLQLDWRNEIRKASGFV